MEASIPAAVPKAVSGTQQRQSGETLAEEVDEEDSLARFCDIDVPIATHDIRAKEQSTDVLPHDVIHVSMRHSGPVKLGKIFEFEVGVIYDRCSSHAKRAISEQRSE